MDRKTVIVAVVAVLAGVILANQLRKLPLVKSLPSA